MQMTLFVLPLSKLVAKIGFPLRRSLVNSNGSGGEGEALCLNKITRLLEREGARKVRRAVLHKIEYERKKKDA